MIGWTPKVYETLKELPKDMPANLKEHIAAEEKQHGSIPKVGVGGSGREVQAPKLHVGGWER